MLIDQIFEELINIDEELERRKSMCCFVQTIPKSFRFPEPKPKTDVVTRNVSSKYITSVDDELECIVDTYTRHNPDDELIPVDIDISEIEDITRIRKQKQSTTSTISEKRCKLDEIALKWDKGDNR